MITEVSKLTLRNKSLRNTVRRIFREEFEVVREPSDPKFMLLHKLLRPLYKNFDPCRDMFNTISLQTRTGCNYHCRYCPVSNPRVNLYGGAGNGREMEMDLFRKIIDELGKMRFKGIIIPYLMNEPLLDKRMFQFIGMIREKCPEAFVFVQTNGLLLDERFIVEAIDAGLDEIIVNDYSEKRHVASNISRMKIAKKYWGHLTLETRSQKERLTNRAGSVDIYPPLPAPLKMPCYRPFRQMHVTFDGRCILCCQDWEFAQVLGNVHTDSLLNIWQNDQYQALRQSLLERDRSQNPLCAKCDCGGLM